MMGNSHAQTRLQTSTRDKNHPGTKKFRRPRTFIRVRCFCVVSVFVSDGSFAVFSFDVTE